MSVTSLESVSLVRKSSNVPDLSIKQTVGLIPKQGKFSKPSSWININVFGMIFFHVAAVWTVFAISPSLHLVAGSYLLLAIRMFGITGGYHRYFSHRSYQTSRIFQFFLAFLGGSALQKGALWWSSHHRYHHKWSDLPEDTHSPTQQGFIWAHLGWFLLSKDNTSTLWQLIPDLNKFPELVWLNRHHWIPGFLLGTGIYWFAGFAAFMWAFIVGTVLLWHITFCINSLAHVFGSVRYKTADTSRNSMLLGILAMGEGWHNNHHAYKSSANNGFFWWEIDVTFYILLTLEKLRIVWDLRRPPLEQLAKLEVVPRDETYDCQTE